MTPEYKEAVAAWVAKAKSDLDTARVLIHGTEPHLDTGSYHCQQSAEKVLKAWLTSQKQEFTKTHDLIVLLNQCISVQPEFDFLLEHVRFLVPFATQFRYPGELFEPPLEEARQALEYATAIFLFVTQRLDNS